MPVVPPGFLVYFGRAVELGVQDATLPSGATKPVDGDGNPVSVLLAPYPGGPGEQIAVYDKPPLAGGVEVVGVFQPYDAATDSFAGTPVDRPPVDAAGVPVACLVPDTYPVLYDAAGHAINPWPQAVTGGSSGRASVAFIYQNAAGAWVDAAGASVTSRPDADVVFARVTVAGTTLPDFMEPEDWGAVAMYGPVTPDEGNPPPITGPGPVTNVASVVGPPAAAPHVDVTWDAPLNDGGSPITGYQTAIGSQVNTVPLPWDARSYRFAGLQRATTYSAANGNPLRVRAFNSPETGSTTNHGPWTDVPALTTPAYTIPDDSGGTASSAPMAPTRHVISMYQLMWTNSPTGGLATIPADVNLVHLAFLQNTEMVGYGKEGSWANVRARVLELRARGCRVYVSTGGSRGAINYSNRAGLIAAFKNIRNNLGGGIPLDGWDIDAEGPAVNTRGSDGKYDIVYITEQLRAEFGPQFHCSMAPNGNYIDQYQPVAVALHKGAPVLGGGQPGLLSYMGQQFYEWEAGSWATWKSAALSRMASAVGAGIPPEKYYVGNMMKSSPDAKMSARAYWSTAEVSEFLDAAHDRWPTMAGAYLWMNGDPNRQQWVDVVKSKINAWAA